PRSTLFPYTTLFRSSSDLRRLDEARHVASQFHADVVLLNGLADAGAQVAVDTRVLDVATGAMLGFASAGVTKDATVQRMLETGRSEEHTSELQSPCN